jgi:hypothetical protein
MNSVEKEGMKLYSKLGEIGGGQSVKLQDNLEDCDKYGAYNLYLCGL